MSAKTNPDRLLHLLHERAFRCHDTPIFKLVSGAMSRFYVDCKPVSLDPEGATLIGTALFDRIQDLPVEGCGGMTLGADPIATAVALTSFLRGKPVPAFIVRKEPKGHGTGKQVEGPLRPGARVVVVEDVVTTGESAMRAMEALRREGHTILKVIALIDRKEGGADRITQMGIPFESLFTIDDLARHGHLAIR
jgi:orotate phosphoribosyltransferase